jgi:hypothetical protein
MRIAALVFSIFGLAYLAWDVSLTITRGIHLGTWFMAIVAAALLYQSYALFRAKKGARWSGIFIAIVIAVSCAYIAILLVSPSFPDRLLTVPAILRPTLGALIAGVLAFSVAAVFLAFARPTAP